MSALDDEIRDMMRYASERSILPRYRKLRSDEIEEKSKDDFVTIADREVEDFLTEGLTKLAPDVAVVGEEAVHADPSIMDRLSGSCWIIDPIDGTTNYASGSGHFAVMIALADAGETIAGWIYDPIRDRLCSAHKDGGSFMNGEKITAKPSGDQPPNLAAMTKFMSEQQRENFLREIAPHYTLVDAPGCAGEQYPLTAFGGHDLAIYERTLPWDHAAGCLFLNEAGGKCTRLDGSAYRVDDGGAGMIGAASAELFDRLAGQINDLPSSS